jgi:LPXTG-site transpeptidase (sortase) family protein
MVLISKAGNEEPIVSNPIPDQSVPEDGNFSFSFPPASFYDPDGSSPLQYGANLADGGDLPGWLHFDPATQQFSGTAPDGAESDYEIRITAFDADGGSINQTFKLNVGAPAGAGGSNVPPGLRILLADQNVKVGGTLSYTFDPTTFYDADGDTLTYTAAQKDDSALPGWLHFDAATRTFSGAPGEENVGTVLVKVTADDGHSHQTSDVFLVAVRNSDDTKVYYALNRNGEVYTDEFGKIEVPYGLGAPDAPAYITIENVEFGPGPNEKYQSMNRGREITFHQADGTAIHQLGKEINVCFAMSSAEWHSIRKGAQGPVIGTSEDDAPDWKWLDTVESGSYVCAKVDHLSRFDVFRRYKSSSLPTTGFEAGVETVIPEQPEEKAYHDQDDLWLEIPALGVKEPILGVDPLDGQWDLTWLGEKVGWLSSTAYPTWAGNSVLTGHNYQSNGKPGPFVYLGKLKYDDEIIVHLGDEKVVYRVRTVDERVDPGDTSALKHEDLPWLTLITCGGYDEVSHGYEFRTVVRAVQVKVE